MTMSSNDSRSQAAHRAALRLKAGISKELALDLEDLDAGVHSEVAHIDTLARAIERLATDDTVRSLAGQIHFWSMSVSNSVNVFAGDVGCSHQEDDNG